MIRLFGIPVRIHPLMWMIFAASLMTGYILEIIVLFGVVFIHELGHAAAARSLQWRVRAIRLLPFGGVAEVEEHGSVPAWQDVIVTLAGPLQHVWMIAFALVCERLGLWGGAWTEYFIHVNMMIGLFNLLPILPLDGGKLLQILLSLWMSYYQTLHLSHVISLLCGSLMIAVSLGIWHAYGIDLNLLMIGIFLFVSNWVDYRNISYIFLRFLMGREQRMRGKLAGGMTAHPILVTPGHTVSQVVKMLKREQYHVIYICNEEGEIKQTLPEQRVIRAFLMRNH